MNEKLPKQVKYQIRPGNTSLITAFAQFNGEEYEGRGFTQREAKNDAAAALLKANPHLRQTQVRKSTLDIFWNFFSRPNRK